MTISLSSILGADKAEEVFSYKPYINTLVDKYSDKSSLRTDIIAAIKSAWAHTVKREDDWDNNAKTISDIIIAGIDNHYYSPLGCVFMQDLLTFLRYDHSKSPIIGVNLAVDSFKATSKLKFTPPGEPEHLRTTLNNEVLDMLKYLGTEATITTLILFNAYSESTRKYV